MTFTQFLMLTAAVCLMQNLVLSQAMGVESVLSLAKSGRRVFLLGVVTTICMAIGLPLTWMAFGMQGVNPIPAALLPLVLALILCALYLGLHYLAPACRLKDPELFLRQMRVALFGTGLAGCMLITGRGKLDIVSCLAFSLGSGLGFCAALFLSVQAHRRFQQGDVPKPFQGVPAALLYFGILSLSLYGLFGGGLPF